MRDAYSKKKHPMKTTAASLTQYLLSQKKQAFLAESPEERLAEREGNRNINRSQSKPEYH